MNHLDCGNWDNGVYIIAGWKIIGRRYFKAEGQDAHPLMEMMKDIDASQPEKDRLGNEFFDAEIIPVEVLHIGEIIFMKDVIAE